MSFFCLVCVITYDVLAITFFHFIGVGSSYVMK
jgi:hypothetical protein